MKKVSIIIACRNEEEFLGPCLMSLLEQDYPQELIEIIVVDGMSTDQTWGVANSFRETYPNVDLEVNLKKHKYAGLNQAIKENVTGEIVAIADAHSIYPKDYVGALVLGLETNATDNIGGGRVFKPRSNGFLSKALSFAQIIPFSLFK
jgi:cellulose synthase/poly-beta-1,6-N-acetylglucosamine synthase-like glycosyltransferase